MLFGIADNNTVDTIPIITSAKITTLKIIGFNGSQWLTTSKIDTILTMQSVLTNPHLMICVICLPPFLFYGFSYLDYSIIYIGHDLINA